MLEPEVEPDGLLGGVAGAVVEPDDEAPEEGLLGADEEPAEEEPPEGGVLGFAARSLCGWSQPARSPAPSARDTATASAESLMWLASVVRDQIDNNWA